MKLKEKTHKKFVEFFNEQNRISQNNEFELAFAEIQRTTGTASVTLKRALNTLVEDGFISMVPGRNSRYARFKVVNPEGNTVEQSVQPDRENANVDNLEQDLELLKRRVRSQEIAISLLQDRLADLEEKLKH